MKTFEYTITDEVGIHARGAGLLVKECKELASSVTLTSNGKSADAKKLMALLALGVKKGDTVKVEISGTDEEQAAEKIEAFFQNSL